MIIQHNIAALNSHRQLSINNSSTSKNLEKLSSGYRINRAGDDAAGLAISEKMRGQIRGLAKAEENTSHAINLIQTAEGGLQETHAILQRMRELAVQSANGTYDNPNDRANLQREFERLTEEIDRISVATHYNGIQLLDGTQGEDIYRIDYTANADAGAAAADFTAAFPTTYAAGTVTWTGTGVAATDTFKLNLIYDETGALNTELSTVEYENVAGGSTITLQAASITVGPTGTGLTVTFEDSDIELNISTITDGIVFDNDATSQDGMIVSMTVTAAAAGAASVTTAPAFAYADKVIADDPGDGLTFQIGANGTADQKMGLFIEDMGAAALGITVLSYKLNGDQTSAMRIGIGLQDEANAAITVINDAINTVSAQRAELGAAQNRLEHTLNNLGVTKENLTSAESTIRDVDMAKEMMEYTKNSILVQASQAMLAQAQSLPQGVLQLLR